MVYVTAILQGSSIGTRVLYQIALGTVKFLWGELMVKQMFRRFRPSGINKVDDAHSTVFVLLVLIVNNIVVPFIADCRSELFSECVCASTSDSCIVWI